MPVHTLHLIHNLKREGAQTMVANLVMSLETTAASATVYAWRDGGAYGEALRRADVSVVERPVSGWARHIRAAVALRRFVKSRHVDVVHAHMSDSAILSAVTLIGTGVPLIVTHHSNRLLPKAGKVGHAIRRALLIWAARRAVVNVAVTQNVADRLERELGLSKDRIACIANGVAVPPSDRAGEARLARLARWGRPGWPRIVALGRLAQVKRQDLAIRALSHVRRSLPAAHLVVAGGGPLMPELARLAERLGLEPCVTFAGSTDDVPGLLRSADLFVSTSSYEGLPVAVLEAMSWGLPVIVTDVPGHNDVVRDGVDGGLAPFEDPIALADRIVRFAESERDADAMGAAARRRVSDEYSAARMAESYLRLYIAATRLSPEPQRDLGEAIRQKR